MIFYIPPDDCNPAAKSGDPYSLGPRGFSLKHLFRNFLVPGALFSGWGILVSLEHVKFVSSNTQE